MKKELIDAVMLTNGVSEEEAVEKIIFCQEYIVVNGLLVCAYDAIVDILDVSPEFVDTIINF